MSIINEVFSLLDIQSLSDSYRYYNLGGKVVYIENFIRIITFTPQEIILKLKKGMIKIIGESLLIEDLNNSCILIKGEIKGVQVY